MAVPEKRGAATANKYTCTNCLYQVLWVTSSRTRTRCPAAKPAYLTSSTLGVSFIAFFFLIFLSICMVIFISPVNFILCVFKLIVWLYRSQIFWKKKGINGTLSVELAALSDKRALRLHILSECATWQLKELGINSLYKYTLSLVKLLAYFCSFN